MILLHSLVHKLVYVRVFWQGEGRKLGARTHALCVPTLKRKSRMHRRGGRGLTVADRRHACYLAAQPPSHSN